MPVACSTEDELSAIALLCAGQWEQEEHWIIRCSKEQAGSITAIFNRALDDRSRENRLRVISRIINRPIISTKMLTRWEARALIENFKAPGNPWALTNIAEEIIRYVEQSTDDQRSIESDGQFYEAPGMGNGINQPESGAKIFPIPPAPAVSNGWADLPNLW